MKQKSAPMPDAGVMSERISEFWDKYNKEPVLTMNAETMNDMQGVNVTFHLNGLPDGQWLKATYDGYKVLIDPELGYGEAKLL